MESVQILMAIEEAFKIELSGDEVGQSDTVGKMADTVYARLRHSPGDPCPSQQGFYIVRKALMEEFGLARDWEPLHDVYNPQSPTTYRDLYYSALYEEVYNSVITGGPVAGDNFWAWGGQARPGNDWIGDPPHETSGWYSVYNTDNSTLAIISTHAIEMNRANK